jgi:hypothetical protein
MVARLRAKPGGHDIEVAIGDFATTRVGGEFSVVYVVFNTIFNLLTQDAQVACFQNAAAHLRSGGRFVDRDGGAWPPEPPGRPDHHPFRADPQGIGFGVALPAPGRFHGAVGGLPVKRPTGTV